MRVPRNSQLSTVPWRLSATVQYQFTGFKTSQAGSMLIYAGMDPFTLTTSEINGMNALSSVFDQYRINSAQIRISGVRFSDTTSHENTTLFWTYDPDGGSEIDEAAMLSRNNLKVHTISFYTPKPLQIRAVPGVIAGNGQVELRKFYDFASSSPTFNFGQLGCRASNTLGTTTSFTVVVDYKINLTMKGKR